MVLKNKKANQRNKIKFNNPIKKKHKKIKMNSLWILNIIS